MTGTSQRILCYSGHTLSAGLGSHSLQRQSRQLGKPARPGRGACFGNQQLILYLGGRDTLNSYLNNVLYCRGAQGLASPVPSRLVSLMPCLDKSAGRWAPSTPPVSRHVETQQQISHLGTGLHRE
jgi:hypothetical protein